MQIIRHQFQYGLLKLKIGARVTVQVGKGRGSVAVGDKTRHPKADFVFRCISCRKDYPNEAEMRADHPGEKEMIASESVHIWGFYSDAPAEAPQEVPKDASKDVRAEIERSNAALPKIGLVSDEAWT